jgi:hypothetical protein
LNINLQAHSEMHSGYGRFGVYTKRALEQYGVVSVGDIGLAPQTVEAVATEPFNDPQSLELARVALWLSTPPHVRGWYEGQLAAIFTMWESTEIPPGFRQNLHHFDRVFVPSQQNLELYRRFHPDVRYIPLGVDGEKWHPRQRPPIKRDFRFLTAGYGPRKGAAQVAKAFLTVFPDGKPPTPLDPIPRLQIRSRDDIRGPGITSIKQDLSGTQELELYANAHCYVSGSKGEGWGFMPLQAIAQGLPTILGNAHGHAAFAHYGIPIDTHPYDATGATFWGDGGEWWEPDFDQMCEAMWDVYNNYISYEMDAIAHAYAAIDEFPWSRTAEELIFNLPELFEPAPTEKVWKMAPPKLFHIRVNKACTYVVNGTSYHFEPGQDYYEAADLKRAIIAAGHLDWSTFDPNDLGLEDNANVAELRAKNSICSTCHQPYNRDDTLRELIGALDE